MDETTQTVAACAVIVAPAAAGALLLWPGRRLDRASGWLGVSGSLVAFLCAVRLILDGTSGVRVIWELAPSLGFVVSLRLEPAPLALAALVAGVGALVLQFARAYFGGSPKGRRAIATLSLFQAAMLGVVLADDLLLLFTFWELTGLCSFFLIQTDADEKEGTFESAQQAFVVTVAGALPMLLGFLYLGIIAGTSSLSQLQTIPLAQSDQTIAFALILLGVLSKSAQVPFHFWLPGAMAAPTPISAYLHSATMVKAGLILLLYLYPIVGDTALWQNVLVPLGVVTCVWGSWCALGQDDIKLLMAWSTVSQLGLMTMTIGLGTDLAIRAAALHLFAHAIFKAGLFLTIGAVDHAAHTRKLSELGGLARRMPWLTGAAALLAGSMAGLPPFAGFLSKELVLEKLTLTEPIVHDMAVFGIVLGSIGTVAYSSRFFFATFFGKPRSEGARKAHAPGPAFLFAPALLAVLTLVAGVGAPLTDQWLLEPFTASLLGYGLAAPKLALWHGITVPLLLSLAIVALGYTLHRWLAHHHLPLLPETLQGPALFARLLARAAALGERFNRLLAGARPSAYFAIALALGFGAGASLPGRLSDLSFEGASPAAVVILCLQALSLLLVLIAQDRLPRILALTIVGFTMALLYGHLLGPDLVLTQLLVDVLTTVFFVLVLRFVARAESGGGRESQRHGRADGPRGFSALAAAVFSLALGAIAAGLVVALAEVPSDTRLADRYFVDGPAIAKGTNLVNLVLADFRGLDTAGETIVVLLAALGAAAFFSRREAAPPREVDGRRVDSFLLFELSRLIVPLAVLLGLALFIKGHDRPGGGFVGGLALAVGAVLATISWGEERARAAMRVAPEVASVIGAVVLGVTVLLPLLAGDPMLTHYHGDLAIFGVELLHWSTTQLFEVGVVLIVGAGLAAAATRLWASRSATGAGS